MNSLIRWSFAAFCAVVLITGDGAFSIGAQSTYEASKHGNAITGVQRLADESPGSCAQCHESHGSRNGIPNAGPFDHTMFAADDETLCYECHSTAGADGAYPGNVEWADSTHSASPEMYWRGPAPPARRADDAGKCVNCHDPHGKADAGGVIPSMNHSREESLCYGCHDGTPSKDIRAQFQKIYRHPIETSARHAAAEAGSDRPDAFESFPSDRRHAECADCHNPHVARSDAFAAVAPEASQKLAGVSRIEVMNGAAGTTPAYSWRAAVNSLAANEYQICFKCHSSWTRLPNGKPDLSIATNPNNPSFHPIQAQGKNRNIDPLAFEAGWTWDRQTWCSDCHGSDDPLVNGPHGSSNRWLLKRPYPIVSLGAPMMPTDFCFSCHRYAVYADPAAPVADRLASRFNQHSRGGHVAHVGEQRISCYACHATHGSATEPALIHIGRTPGISLYQQRSNGGTCTPTCHNARAYTVNYAR